MKWFKKQAAAAPVQLRSGAQHPFGMLGDYVPLQGAEDRLYPVSYTHLTLPTKLEV